MATSPVPGNMAKLSMSNILRLSRDLGLQILGPRGTLHGYTAAQNAALAGLPSGELGAIVTEMALFAPGPTDLRRHRRDPAQHHRRAGPGPAQGTQPRQGDPLPGPPPQLIGPVDRDQQLPGVRVTIDFVVLCTL